MTKFTVLVHQLPMGTPNTLPVDSHQVQLLKWNSLAVSTLAANAQAETTKMRCVELKPDDNETVAQLYEVHKALPDHCKNGILLINVGFYLAEPFSGPRVGQKGVMRFLEAALLLVEKAEIEGKALPGKLTFATLDSDKPESLQELEKALGYNREVELEFLRPPQYKGLVIRHHPGGERTSEGVDAYHAMTIGIRKWLQAGFPISVGSLVNKGSTDKRVSILLSLEDLHFAGTPETVELLKKIPADNEVLFPGCNDGDT